MTVDYFATKFCRKKILVRNVANTSGDYMLLSLKWILKHTSTGKALREIKMFEYNKIIPVLVLKYIMALNGNIQQTYKLDFCIKNLVLYIEKQILISSSQRIAILLKSLHSPAGISIFIWQVTYTYVTSLGLDYINITIVLHYACPESIQAYSAH